jgi:hypothetical protein
MVGEGVMTVTMTKTALTTIMTGTKTSTITKVHGETMTIPPAGMMKTMDALDGVVTMTMKAATTMVRGPKQKPTKAVTEQPLQTVATGRLPTTGVPGQRLVMGALAQAPAPKHPLLQLRRQAVAADA